MGKRSRATPPDQNNDKVSQNAVLPAQAGIQMKDVNLVSLDSRLRWKDGKTELVSGCEISPQRKTWGCILTRFMILWVRGVR